MRTLSKIACRTTGTIGMGVALYEAYRVGKQFAKNGAQNSQAKYLEKAYYNSRTIDKVSYTSNSIRQKTFDLRTKNPLPAIWGKIKGGFEGATYGLGENLFTVACSSCAILSKGFLAKIGAIGLGLKLCYEIARSGFGLGKEHPMN